MSARAIWTGLLQLALVRIPVRLYPATASTRTLRPRHLLHAKCQTQITQPRHCPTCQKHIPAAEIVTGYEVEPGRFVVLTHEDVDTLRPASTTAIAITVIGPAADLDWRARAEPYWLTPDGPAALAPYRLLADSLTGLVAIGSLSLYGRASLVGISPQQSTLRLQVLRHADEWRNLDVIDKLQTWPPVVAPAERRAMGQLVTALAGPLDCAFVDEWEAGIEQLIATKIAGGEVVTPPPSVAPPLLSLADALAQSLAAVSGRGKKRTAKASLGSRARRR